MPSKRQINDDNAFSRSHGQVGAIGISETRWQDRPLLSLQLASEIAAISAASLYRFADEGRLSLRRLAGRTLVETGSLIELLNSAEPWKPSQRGKEARAKRSARST